eukprot:11114754-Alexandrium_andersonii.AAC.1
MLHGQRPHRARNLRRLAKSVAESGANRPQSSIGMRAKIPEIQPDRDASASAGDSRAPQPLAGSSMRGNGLALANRHTRAH